MFGLLLALWGPVGASQVFHQPLAEVVTTDSWVLEARVLQVESRVTGGGGRQVVFTVQPVALHHGQGQALMLSYATPAMVRTMPDGSELRVSPILSGSGHEFLVQAGATWLFIAGAGPDESLLHIVSRVEPLASLPQVMALARPERPHIPEPPDEPGPPEVFEAEGVGPSE